MTLAYMNTMHDIYMLTFYYYCACIAVCAHDLNRIIYKICFCYCCPCLKMFVLSTSIRSYAWFDFAIAIHMCICLCSFVTSFSLSTHMVWFCISIHIHMHVFAQCDSIRATYVSMWTWLLILSTSIWMYFKIHTYLWLEVVLSSWFMHV